MKIKGFLQQVNDPRSIRGQEYRLWSILGLIIVGFLCGRRNLRAVFRMGRTLNATQRSQLGFVNGRTPCHPTLTETVRILDPDDLIQVLLSIAKGSNDNGRDDRHISIDGKTMRATKNEKGNAAHVLSPFGRGLKRLSARRHRTARGWKFLMR